MNNSTSSAGRSALCPRPREESQNKRAAHLDVGIFGAASGPQCRRAGEAYCAKLTSLPDSFHAGPPPTLWMLLGLLMVCQLLVSLAISLTVRSSYHGRALETNQLQAYTNLANGTSGAIVVREIFYRRHFLLRRCFSLP